MDTSDEVSQWVDVAPLKKDSLGTTKATSVHYQSDLVSNWYQHGCKHSACKEKWSEFDRLKDDFEDLKLHTAQTPIIHRHVSVDGRWTTQNITIQDPAMRTVLGEVLRDYWFLLDCEFRRWTFEPDFTPFVHRWNVLKQLRDANSGNATLQNAASGLIAFLEPLISESLVSLAQATKTGLIAFKDLPLIFEPGALVQTDFFDAKVICRVVSCNKALGCVDLWTIDVEFIDWNGEITGYDSATINIDGYHGQYRVTSLPIFPISFLADPEAAKAEAIERGRKFEALRGYHVKSCNGTKLVLDNMNPYQPRSVSSRVCVDPYAYYRSRRRPLVVPRLRPLYKKEDEGKDPDRAKYDVSNTPDIRYSTDFAWEPLGHEVIEADDFMSDDGMSGPGISIGRKYAHETAQGISTPAKSLAERTEDLRPLNEEQLLLTTPWVKGFDLTAKEWCLLRVDDLSDTEWDDAALDKLVLPDERKHLIRSLAKNSRGLVVLMAGPPGVAKTSTAKAVAELLRVPLYTVRASDIGPNIWDAKLTLNNGFRLCHMWNAILLLDGADAYLCQNNTELIGLVPFLLTKLVHYQGILFISTKRLSAIDSTLELHVDLTLLYHDLTRWERRQVWRNLTERAGGRDKFDLDSSEGNGIDQLSQFIFNGHVIKSLIESALRLSAHTDSRISADRLLELANIREEVSDALEDETA